MHYYKVIYKLTPYNEDASDIMIAQLGELGYESFLEIEGGFEAYVQEQYFDESAIGTIDPYIEGVTYTVEASEVEDADWNEEWEKNYFKPIEVDGVYYVRGPHHESNPLISKEVIINPKNAFGAGHHETTGMMMHFLLNIDLREKRVIDMGCGTGILGIMAAKEGAKDVIGIDIDAFSVENTKENCALNLVENMEVRLGGADVIRESDAVDVFIANINRNILLADLPIYRGTLASGGVLLLSGFYEDDVDMLVEKAESLGMKLEEKQERNEWRALRFSVI
ncbi:MAG: 50S ribosomal protein L11 methyltransferase [Bacteroidia bacterium]|nr:50S ribosomal protein L11 methyltransferase [Bacteroidia bacterium]